MRPDKSKLPPQKNRRWVMSLSAEEELQKTALLTNDGKCT
jgi:hypothetical protein